MFYFSFLQNFKSHLRCLSAGNSPYDWAITVLVVESIIASNDALSFSILWLLFW